MPAAYVAGLRFTPLPTPHTDCRTRVLQLLRLPSCFERDVATRAFCIPHGYVADYWLLWLPLRTPRGCLAGLHTLRCRPARVACYTWITRTPALRFIPIHLCRLPVVADCYRTVAVDAFRDWIGCAVLRLGYLRFTAFGWVLPTAPSCLPQLQLLVSARLPLTVACRYRIWLRTHLVLRTTLHTALQLIFPVCGAFTVRGLDVDCRCLRTDVVCSCLYAFNVAAVARYAGYGCGYRIVGLPLLRLNGFCPRIVAPHWFITRTARWLLLRSCYFALRLVAVYTGYARLRLRLRLVWLFLGPDCVTARTFPHRWIDLLRYV